MKYHFKSLAHSCHKVSGSSRSSKTDGRRVLEQTWGSLFGMRANSIIKKNVNYIFFKILLLFRKKEICEVTIESYFMISYSLMGFICGEGMSKFLEIAYLACTTISG